MTIEVINPRMDASHTVRLDIAGVDNWPVQYSKSSQFRPITLTLNYHRNSASGDDVWRFINALITGPRIKSDGSDSIQTGKYTYGGYDQDIPDWIQTAAATHHPEKTT